MLKFALNKFIMAIIKRDKAKLNVIALSNASIILSRFTGFAVATYFYRFTRTNRPRACSRSNDLLRLPEATLHKICDKESRDISKLEVDWFIEQFKFTCAEIHFVAQCKIIIRSNSTPDCGSFSPTRSSRSFIRAITASCRRMAVKNFFLSLEINSKAPLSDYRVAERINRRHHSITINPFLVPAAVGDQPAKRSPLNPYPSVVRA